MRNMHGGQGGLGRLFLMPHTECEHRRGSPTGAFPARAAWQHLIGPTGCFFLFVLFFLSKKKKHYTRSQGFTLRCSLYRHRSPCRERVSTTHHNLYPQFGVQSRNVNSSTFCFSLSFCVPLCVSLQVSVLEVPVLKGEPLFFPLAPFLIVEVNVSALDGDRETEKDFNKQENENISIKEQGRKLSISSSEVNLIDQLISGHFFV